MAAYTAIRKTRIPIGFFIFLGCFSIFDVTFCEPYTDDWRGNDYISALGESSPFIDGGRQSGYTSECLPLIHQFSNASASFILCAANFAKPLRFCEWCSGNYTDVITSVEKIQRDSKCRDTILNSDVLQIVQRTRTFVENLWTHGNCENCFQSQRVGDTERTYLLSNDTEKFWIYFTDVQECFHDFNNTMQEVNGGGTHLTNSTLCEECHDKYCKLNTFYKHLGASSKLCMDIVEMMNLTRQQWSNEFRCIIHTKDTKVVVTLSVLFCSLPIFFYLGAMIITKKHVIKRPVSPTRESDSGVSPFGSNVR